MTFLNQIIITWILVKIAVRDWKEKRIVNRDTAILFCFSVMQLLLSSEAIKESMLFFHAFFGACSASGLLSLIIIFVPGAFGGGDIKLMAAAGIFLGPAKSLYSLAAAICLCSIYILIGMVRGKLKHTSVVAFGPFLCVGILLFLWNTEILQCLRILAQLK